MRGCPRFLAIVLVACAMLGACALTPLPPGPPPGGPTDPVPEEYLRGTEFDRPTMVRMSWGIYEGAREGVGGPATNHPWAEVRRRLAARQYAPWYGPRW